jgi:hypothetical protein
MNEDQLFGFICVGIVVIVLLVLWRPWAREHSDMTKKGYHWRKYPVGGWFLDPKR